MRKRVASAGEPFQSYFVPATFKTQLNARWFAGRRDGLAVSGLARMMVAWV